MSLNISTNTAALRAGTQLGINQKHLTKVLRPSCEWEQVILPRGRSWRPGGLDEVIRRD